MQNRGVQPIDQIGLDALSISVDRDLRRLVALSQFFLDSQPEFEIRFYLHFSRLSRSVHLSVFVCT